MDFKIMENVTNMQVRSDLPNFSSGDTVIVSSKIKDGNKFRVQKFEGVVIKRASKNGTQTITVRKIINGIGVERIFPIHSPLIEKITVVKQGKVRQSRIYYLRKLSGKAARIKEKK